MKKRIRILFLDSDGVLLDMEKTIGDMGGLKNKWPQLYSVLRKICILLYADRIVGEKLYPREGAKDFLDEALELGYKPIVVTRRPAWALKRLEKQLLCFYEGIFDESNIFSSNLSRKKFKMMQKIIDSFGDVEVEGFFIDDNYLNFQNLPAGITPIQLKTPDDFKMVGL